jgi:hypothetical protein
MLQRNRSPSAFWLPARTLRDTARCINIYMEIRDNFKVVTNFIDQMSDMAMQADFRHPGH